MSNIGSDVSGFRQSTVTPAAKMAAFDGLPRELRDFFNGAACEWSIVEIAACLAFLPWFVLLVELKKQDAAWVEGSYRDRGFQ